MNIKDLLEQYQTQRSERFVKTARMEDDPIRSPKTKPLGRGTVAKVYDHPSDAHMVNRVTKSYKSGDHEQSYETFIEAMLDDPHMKDNIHMPRVYGVKKFKSREGRVRARYELEKLVMMHNVDEVVLKAAIDSVYNIDADDGEYSPRELPWRFASELQYAISYNEFDNVISEEFLEALKFIKEVKKRARGVGYDLHEENIMLRITPTGAQIVFTDPL